MYGTFFGLNTALRGLMAQQAALDVTSHNISNVNTDGYSRQRADLAASTPYTLPAMNMVMPSQVGTGVDVSGYSRMRDQFIDTNLRAQMGNQSSYDTSLGLLQQVEAAFNEPGNNGLSAQFQKFFAAMDNVAAHPQDLAARSALIGQGQSLANTMNNMWSQLTAIQTQALNQFNADVTQINGYSAQIASLNTQIRDAQAMGMNPNDLRDTRDKIIDQLSQKVNLQSVTENAQGEVTITFGTTTPINLVDPTIAGPPAGYTVVTPADFNAVGPPAGAYQNGDLTSGEVYADLNVANSVIGGPTGYLAQLDTLANDLMTRMNAQQAAGFDLAGAPGANMFSLSGVPAVPGDVIQMFQVNPALTATQIAAASVAGAPANSDNITAAPPATSFFQQRALAVAGLNNMTWEDYYRGIVSNVGSVVSQTQQAGASQDVVVSALQGRREDTSGVSLDEEMSNMLRFQHAYNAAARVLTAFDDELDTLINRMGRVGL